MSNENQNHAVGYVSILLCCLASAISFVFIAHMTKTHDQMLSIAITFSYAVVMFNVFNIKNISYIYSSVVKNIKLISIYFFFEK